MKSSDEASCAWKSGFAAPRVLGSMMVAACSVNILFSLSLLVLMLPSMWPSDISVCWGFLKFLESLFFFFFFLLFLRKDFNRIMVTSTSEHVFHHHQMKALKGQTFDFHFVDTCHFASGNRSTAVQTLFEIVCILGVKIAGSRDKFFRIAVNKSWFRSQLQL